MRHLLFLSHRIPYPPDKGEKIRALRILDYLAQSFHIHLGCFADNPADLSHVPALRERTASLGCFSLDKAKARRRALLAVRPGMPLSLGYFSDRRLKTWVAETLDRVSVAQAFVYSAAMAPYVIDRVGLPRILDMVDVDSEKFAAYAAGTKSAMRRLWARESRTLLNFERRAAREFDRTIFVSAQERARFVELAPECAERTDWVENGVDLEEFSPDHRCAPPFDTDRPVIVFTGTMDYRPNIEAVAWFAEYVMPGLRARRSCPRFYIVGSDPTRSVRDLATSGDVVVTGRVPDIRPYLAHATVVVAPLRIGRGIQNKILQAMAMGRPVVASAQAFEGVQAEAGRDLLVADGADDTIRQVTEVLDGQHPALGSAARSAVMRNHDWSVTLERLDKVMRITQTDTAEPLRALA